MLNSPFDCPVGGVMIRPWVDKLHKGGVEQRRAILAKGECKQ